MKELIKYSGIIVILIGVLILAIPAFIGAQTNVTLGSGLTIIIVGLIAHILINRFISDK